MAGGGKFRLADGDDFAELARVVDGRLLVEAAIGPPVGTSDVNITEIGGNAVGTTLPVSGTVAVTQSTSPWVIGDGGGSITVDGTVTALQGTSPWVIGDGGGSITVDGTVAVSSVGGTVAVTQSTSPWVIGDGGGSITVDGTVSVSGAVAVTQSTSPWVIGDGGGSITVDGTVAVSAVGGTVAVTQSTSPWVIGDGGGSITVDGTVAATQSGVWNISNILVSVTPGTAATHLGKARGDFPSTIDTGVQLLALRNDAQTPHVLDSRYGPLSTDSAANLWVACNKLEPGIGNQSIAKAEDAAHATGSTGVMALAVRNDAGTSLASATGDYIPITTDSVGSVWTRVTTIVPGTAATNLGKAEDVAHATGDTGVMALAVRNDTLAALAGTTGDYIPLTTDSLGRLYVREAGVTTIVLSGSTRGRPIQITGTTSGGANTLHTATTTSGQLDRIYIYLTNTSAAAVTVTIEFGTTGAGNEIDIVVPGNETVLAFSGPVIGGAATDTIKAYATTASVVNAFGRVERLT